MIEPVILILGIEGIADFIEIRFYATIRVRISLKGTPANTLSL